MQVQLLAGAMASITFLVSLSPSAGRAAGDSIVPLPAAHAHNDYRHPHPLLDALAHGFCSVEADVFLIDDQLLVGHTQQELTPERTLTRLYLEPLRHRVERNGGTVYRGGPTCTLLVDFKSDGASTYDALQNAIAPYHSMLRRLQEGQLIEGPVQIIISGNRPIERIAQSDTRAVFVDGRLTDLDRSVDATLMPLISDRWGAHFRWRGDGPMAEQERQQLREIVRRVHERGQRLRFWATPDRLEVWKALRAAEVDLINTDDLAGLAAFLQASPAKTE